MVSSKQPKVGLMQEFSRTSESESESESEVFIDPIKYT